MNLQRIKKNTSSVSSAISKREPLLKSVERRRILLARSSRSRNDNKAGLTLHSNILAETSMSWIFVFPERVEAEIRQKAKQSQKKAKAKSDRQTAEKAAQNLLQISQATRSAAFAAARSGDAARVKKAVWEDGVDASGGEIKPGCEAFSHQTPQDPRETLLHIATKNGNTELVQWLDAHSMFFPSLVISHEGFGAVIHRHLPCRRRSRRKERGANDGDSHRDSKRPYSHPEFLFADIPTDRARIHGHIHDIDATDGIVARSRLQRTRDCCLGSRKLAINDRRRGRRLGEGVIN